MKSAIALLLLALMLTHPFTHNALALKNLEKGDVIKSCLGPWTYALSSNEIWFLRVPPTLDERSMDPDIVSVTQLRRSWSTKFFLWCLRSGPPPKEKKKGDVMVPRIGETGIKLARRMTGMTVYYDLHYCNTRHYVDYVTYGTTFGDPKTNSPFAHKTIDINCPLHKVITKDTDVLADDFYLENGAKHKIEWQKKESKVKKQ